MVAGDKMKSVVHLIVQTDSKIIPAVRYFLGWFDLSSKSPAWHLTAVLGNPYLSKKYFVQPLLCCRVPQSLIESAPQISFLVVSRHFIDSPSTSVSTVLQKQKRRHAMQNWKELGVFAKLKSGSCERPSASNTKCTLFTELGTQEFSYQKKCKGCKEAIGNSFNWDHFTCQRRWKRVHLPCFIVLPTPHLVYVHLSTHNMWLIHRTAYSDRNLQYRAKAKGRIRAFSPCDKPISLWRARYIYQSLGQASTAVSRQTNARA